jgi:hypothetical protein
MGQGNGPGHLRLPNLSPDLPAVYSNFFLTIADAAEHNQAFT